MKMVNRLLAASLIRTALAVTLTLGFLACSTESPLTPQNTLESGLKFVKFPSNRATLQKIIAASQWIEAAYGGRVKLRYDADFDTLNYEVEISLDIAAGAMSQDAAISLAIDDVDFASYLDVYFEPHGTVFSTPAILNLKVDDLDLSGFDVSTLDIYYDNPETGQWEPMERDTVLVDPARGRVKVVNARLPHFSRYALAGD